MSGGQAGPDGDVEGGTAPQLSVFAGTFRHGRDGKGRVVLPAHFRPHFEGTAVISPGAEYIAVRSVAGFESWLDGLVHRPDGVGVTLEVRERLSQLSQQVAVDGQGRMVVPAWLCDRFGIGDNVRVVGRFDHVGIYPDADDDVTDIVDFLTSLGATRAT